MIDYHKRPKRGATAGSSTSATAVTPLSVRRALEVFELWERRVAEAKANNTDPARKAVTVPFNERADAAKALALAVRTWIDRTV